MEILPDGTSGKPFQIQSIRPDLEHKKEYSSLCVYINAAGFPELGRRSMAQPFAPAITGKQKAIILII